MKQAEAAVEPATLGRIQRQINDEVTARFPAGGEQRAVVLQHGDDPVIEPRLAAGEYDSLDEITLAERLTSQLHELCRGAGRPRRAARHGPGLAADRKDGA